MTQRPKIIFTVTNDLTFDQRMQRICTTLQTNGFDCVLVGRKQLNSLSLDNFLFEQIRLKNYFNRGPLFYIEHNLRLFIFLLKHKADCICTIDLDTMLAGFFAGKIRGQKLVYDAHEFFTEVPEVTNRRLIKIIWSSIAHLCVPRYDVAYSVGEKLAEIFTKKYDLKFQTIRNVPFKKVINFSDKIITKNNDNEPNNSNFIEPDKIILYQGALNEGRGLEAAIEAMKSLDARFQLWLAGEGDLSKKLRDLAIEIGVAERVKFLGFVRPADLKTLTDRAWLGLNLLEIKGLSYFYSLANKFFDYIQATVPSLNMAFPEYQKINAEFEVSLLLSEPTATEIVAAVRSLADDETQYARLQTNCRAAAAVFNWENEAVKLVEIYRRLLAIESDKIL